LLLKNPESYSLAWQKTVLARTRQIRKGLLDGSRTWCSEAIPDSYMKGMAWADADPLAGQKLMAGFGGIHQQAVEVMAENTFSRLSDVNSVVGRRVDDIFRTVALEQSKGAVVGYETTRQATKRIKEDLAERGITGFRDKAGHEWDMGRYAKVLANETTKGAFRQGTINRLQEKGHDLVRLSSHSGSCPKCDPWQGRTMSLSGTDPDYPSVDEARGAGVFHVGCLHVISLAPEEKDRYLSSLGKKEVTDAPKESPVLSRSDAEKWAKDSVYKDDVFHVTSKDAAASIKTNGFREASGQSFGASWGNGTYLSLDSETNAYYRSMIINPETLTLKVNIKNPVKFDARNVGDIEEGARAIAGQIGKLEEYDKKRSALDALNKQIEQKATDVLGKPLKINQKPRDESYDAFEKRFEESRQKRIAFLREQGAHEYPHADALTEVVKDAGHDAIIITDGEFRPEIGGNQMVIFNPKNIKIIGS
jgi:hypothetical protein